MNGHQTGPSPQQSAFKPPALRRGRRRSAGFTLIEIMTVVGVIGILSAIAGGVFNDRLISDWRMKEASRNLFNTIVLTRSTARTQGAITTIFFGTPDCGLTFQLTPWNVYSYQRGGVCTESALARDVYFGLPPGAGLGPPDTRGGTHSTDAADGVALSADMLQFNLQGFPTTLLTSRNDTFYLNYMPRGSNQPSSMAGRAIVVRQIGRPQMWSWDMSVNEWNTLRRD